MKIALALTLLISLSACSTTGIVGALSAYNTAEHALSILYTYIGDDEQSNTNLAPHVNAVATLHKKAKSVNSTDSLIDFAEEYGWQITESINHWKSIVELVNEHEARTNKPIPAKLTAFKNDVEAGYKEVKQAIDNKDKTATMQKYIDTLALVAKLTAASQGVIL